MNKSLTELIRDANREITPADRHSILDLIEQQAARIAKLESASKDAIRPEVLGEAALRASIHSQYPVTTEYDRGYAKAREDAATAIRALNTDKPEDQ